MQTVRIASYNIRKAVGLDWKRMPDRIYSVLREMNANVVVLQEADRRLGRRAGVLCPDNLSQLGYQFVEIPTRPESHGWHGNAILFRSPLTVTSAAAINLPCLEPRGAVSATFELDGVTRIEITGVHLSLFQPIRNRQISDLMARHSSSTDCVVIGGDFNDRRSDEVVRENISPEYEVVSPGASFHASKPFWPLDRFLVKGNARVDHGCVHHSKTSRLASDHLPIYIDVTLM